MSTLPCLPRRPSLLRAQSLHVCAPVAPYLSLTLLAQTAPAKSPLAPARAPAPAALCAPTRAAAPAAIFYSLVARKTVVLAEFTGRTGNFPTVTRTLLTKIPEADGKQSYLYDTCVQRRIASRLRLLPQLPLRNSFPPPFPPAPRPRRRICRRRARASSLPRPSSTPARWAATPSTTSSSAA